MRQVAPRMLNEKLKGTLRRDAGKISPAAVMIASSGKSKCVSRGGSAVANANAGGIDWVHQPKGKDQAMHIRCPHCRNPIEVVDDDRLQDLTCPSCGSSFNLLPDETVSRQTAIRKTLGRFELVERIGVGAFGEVWTARDSELDRIVAIKMPRKGQLTAEEAEGFLREARSAARLNHPSIVAVHEVGKEDDQLFIVSDYVHGLTLADWLTGKRPSPKEAAELCAKIADAVQHAHENGVIHRDLKPSNIMLDDDGQPHIMDFGLAKRDAGEITMTVEGRSPRHAGLHVTRAGQG